MTIDKSIAYI